MNDSPATLIIGCGYLGRALARRLLDRDDAGPVWATTRSDDRARELFDLGLRPILLQVTQPVTFAALRPALDHPGPLDVVYLIPPGRPGGAPTPRQTVVGGTSHTVKHLRRVPGLRRAVLGSSTAVYGHHPCPPHPPLTAEAQTDPTNPRARLLLDGEKLWLHANNDPEHASGSFHTLRLAGIYGPGRVVGRHAVAEGHPLVGDPDATLNLIHVVDAADCLLAMLNPLRDPARIELAADGRPITRRRYYHALAQALGVDPPQHLTLDQAAGLGIDTARLRAAASKALDPRTTRERLVWSPRHPSVLDALPELIQQPA
ncbi:MAG: NAD-dependent epimerase/dehydratase family protein [Planctomycetota bacterium]